MSTDVFDIEISTEGGTLQRAILKNYPVHKDQPDVLVQLLDDDPNQPGLLQTGLRSSGEGPEANHRARFTSTRERYDREREISWQRMLRFRSANRPAG